MTSVAILGGGISGLSAAYYLTKVLTGAFSKITLLESRKQLGGWIRTSKYEDGTVFEHGPRSIRGAGKAGYNTLEMVEDLGLEDSILPVARDHPASKHRYIYVKDQLCPLPSGPAGIFKKIPPFSKPLFLMGLKEPFTKSVPLKDESVHSFFKRRFGEEVANYAADPLCRGIFAGDCHQLSMKSCFPQVFNYEQEYGSVIKGAFRAPKDKVEPTSALVQKYRSQKWSMWSLKDGLIQIPMSLHTYLQQQDNVHIYPDSPCTGIEISGNKVKVRWGNQEETVDHVISALPAKDLAGLLSTQHGSLATSLRQMTSASVGVVNLQYDGQLLPVEGFGHLVPSSEPSKVLGVLYESCLFPGHNSNERPTTRVTCMMGGAWFDTYFGDVDKCHPDTLAKIAESTVRDHLKITAKPSRVITSVHKECIPQYVVGHSDIMSDIDSYISTHSLPLHLVGASYRGVSVNECILNSKLAVDKLVQDNL